MREVVRNLALLVIGAALGVAAMLVWVQVGAGFAAAGAGGTAPPAASNPVPIPNAAPAEPAPSGETLPRQEAVRPAAAAAAPAQPSSVAQAAADGLIADIYDRASPSVVRIVVRATTGNRTTREGEGTGIVLDQQGNILTNAHVIEGATTIQVEFVDDIVVSAEVAGRDPATDVAIIRVDPGDVDLVPAALGDSDTIRAGQLAIAIGNPYSLERAVTAGVVSGVGRVRSGLTNRVIRRMIQTDAALNPGNSGGPLLNARGEVIGVNQQIEARTTGTVTSANGDNIPEGIGFAVPINTVKRILPRLIKGETIEHSYLGISGQPLDRQIARELSLSTDRGVYVLSTVASGPAAKAGIRSGDAKQTNNKYKLPEGGDIIVAIEGQPMRTVDDVAEYIDSFLVGTNVKVDVIRDGQPQTIVVTLGAWPAQQTPRQ